MRTWLRNIAYAIVLSVGCVGADLAESTELSQGGGALVTPEEYPVYDAVVESRFLTDATRLVVIERYTTVRLMPADADEQTVAWSEDVRPFDGRVSSALLDRFRVVHRERARLESRFGFTPTVRFVTEDGAEEPEVRWDGVRPVGAAPSVIERLAFSRVAFDLPHRQALVYVAQERPDGGGMGLMVYLHATEQRGVTLWRVQASEVLWVARPDGRGPELELDRETEELAPRG
ncbi:MAG: hypothetical protein U0172_14355 [Nitrospiraceae bacterium]